MKRLNYHEVRCPNCNRLQFAHKGIDKGEVIFKCSRCKFTFKVVFSDLQGLYKLIRGKK